MKQEVMERLRLYAEATNALLETSFYYLDRNLELADYPDHALAPDPVRRSFDDFMFGGTLFMCEGSHAWEISTMFHICFSVLQLDNAEGFVVIGPYLPETGLDVSLEELLVENGVPPEKSSVYAPYMEQLPILTSDKPTAIFRMLAKALYNRNLPMLPRSLTTAEAKPELSTVFTEDSLRMKAEAIARRYEQENAFLDAIVRGEEPDFASMGGVMINRVANRLRNQKNLLIVFNTLMRKSVERAKVHPMYIDEISGKWAVHIERLTTVTQVIPTARSMAADYARLVQRYSLANYTSNVRRTLNLINFNLSDSSLSLKNIAAELGVNANYLSLQFNKEVGGSFPDYVTTRRIDNAKKLITDTSLSISSIAEAVGYSDLNYFTKCFRKTVGCTPTAYRRGQLGR